MRPDVLTLYRFYESPMGRVVAQLIGDRMTRLWMPGKGLQVIGFGYALPYLNRLEQAAADPTSHFHAFMPERQGVCHWPAHMNGRTALVEEYHLPLADSSVDRVLAVHALEHTNRPANLLREIWRVLAPGGQVVIVVPNRRRTWSAFDTTPFGFGRPFSKHQLYDLMQEQMLPPDDWDTALMLPPFKVPGASRMLRWAERPAHMLGRNLGGALMVCARKQVYSALTKGQKKARPVPVFTAP